MNIRVFIENLLRAVTVMHVPVDNEEPISEALLACICDSKRDIRQQAKTHRMFSKTVMPGWTGQRICRLVVAFQNRSQRLYSKAR